MKILIAPDSFKGSLSAVRFCEIAEKTIKSILPDAEIDCMPVADGGEGTLECLQSAMDCKIVKCFVQNSLYEEEVSLVGFIDNGKTAIIEAAKSNGLPQIKGRENPEETSTYGVGQLVAFACDLGAKKIWAKGLRMGADWEDISSKPSSLKNPTALTTFGVVYDGSVAKTVTPSNFIG